MSHKDNWWGLWRHSHFLRAAMNLAQDRHQQLDQTLRRLGFSQIPSDSSDFNRLLTATAKELGDVRTRMLLDAPQEIEKYHHGPLQVALSLFHAVIARYRELSHADPVYQDAALNDFCRKHPGFVNDLEALRHSLLHQRYDNLDTQTKFVTTFAGGSNAHMVTLLIEGARIYEEYVKRLRRALKDGAHG